MSRPQARKARAGKTFKRTNQGAQFKSPRYRKPKRIEFEV